MNETHPVLVTGATGLVGRRLVERLASQGAKVRALSRRASQASLSDGVEVLDWNGRSIPGEALFRCRAVVHLAGEPVFAGRLTPQRKRRIRESRIDSTRQIVSAIEALPAADRPKSLVCASAVGFYGSRGDELLEESASPGDSFLARTCIDWEAAASKAGELGVRPVSLRFGIVLANAGGALPNMALPFRLGLGGRLGSGDQWFPWVHLDDAVGLALAALEDERYHGPVNAVAPNPVTNRQLTRALGRVLHRPTLFAVPAFAIRLALGELSDELLGSRRVSPRVAESHGYRFAHAHLEGALEDLFSG